MNNVRGTESHPITSPIVIDNETFKDNFQGVTTGTTPNTGYEPETAGALMSPNFTAISRDLTIEEALAQVRAQARTAENIYTVYVVGPENRLDGVISLRRLMIADPHALVAAVMTQPAMCVTTDTDQERVVRVFQELDSISVPVVNSENQLVGIVTVDDALDVQADEATEDLYFQGGLAATVGKESERSELMVRGSLWRIWKVRLPFLILAVLGGLVAAIVVERFEASLNAVAAVAMFIPLIMNIGGSVGTQSSTVFARGVAMGHIDINHFGKAFFKEVGVGASLGIITGIPSGLLAAVWTGLPALGMAVGAALIATMTVSALLGFVVPWFLVKIGTDHAAGAAPIITSIKDITALLIYFAFVTLFLSHLL